MDATIHSLSLMRFLRRLPHSVRALVLLAACLLAGPPGTAQAAPQAPASAPASAGSAAASRAAAAAAAAAAADIVDPDTPLPSVDEPAQAPEAIPASSATRTMAASS